MKEKAAQKESRRGKFKRRMTLALAVALALALAFVVLTKSRLLPYQVSNYINEHLLKDTRFEFTCSAITGDLVRNVVLHDPVVRFHAEDASYNVFRADRIAIDYSIAGVFRLNMVVRDLSLHNVRLQIRQDADGRVILPIPVEDEFTSPDGAFAPRVDVQRFDIDGLNMVFGGEERRLAVRDVDLAGSYLLERGQGRLRVDRGNAYIIELETPIQSFTLDVYHEQDTVRIRDFSAKLGRSLIMANGDVKAGRLDDLQLIFNPVVLEEFHALGLIPDIEGEFGGDVTVNGGMDEITLGGRVTGTGFGMVFNAVDFNAKIGSDGIDFDKVAGQVFGATVDGRFWYGWGERKGFGYDGKVRGLDLVNSFLQESGLPSMDVSADGSIVHDGDKRYTIRAEVDSARVDRYETGSGIFEAVWHDDTGLRIDSYRFVRPGYTVEGSGSADPEANLDLLFNATGGDLTYFWDYASLPRVGGSVVVGGRIAGPIEDLQMNLNGTVYDVDYLIATIDSAAVRAEVRGIGGDDVTARVDVNGDRVNIAGRPFDAPHLRFLSSGGTTVVRDFSFSKGDTATTMDFDVIPAGDDVKVRFKHLEVAMPTGLWRNRFPSTLVVGDGVFELDSLVLASGESIVGFDGVYSEGDGTIDVSGWGTDFDLVLLRQAFNLPIKLEGKGDFRGWVRGDLSNPHVSLTASIGRGAVDSLVFDELRLDAGFAGDRWRVDELLVVNEGDSLSAVGWWEFETSPVAVVAGRETMDEGVDDPVRLDVTSRHFSLPVAMAALHAPEFLGGAFTGTVTVEHTIGDPHILMEGKIDPRGGLEEPVGLRVPETRVAVSHRDGKIEITEVAIGRLNSTITGVLPVGVSLLHGLQPRSSEPVRLELNLSSADIAPLLAYTSRLSGLSGLANGRVTVGGTLADPIFGGRVTFADGRVRFTDLDEMYTDIESEVDFHDNVMELTSIRGKSRRKDAFTGTGWVEFDGFRPSDYRLDLSFSDFWVTREPDFEAMFDGALAVAKYEDGDRVIPNVTGQLKIKQAEVLYEFQQAETRSPVTMPTAAPGWICSIDLDAHKNLWVRNPDLNVELGGQLIVMRDHQGLYLRGDLSALRGTYTVYNNKFHVVEGTLDFSAAVGIRPEVYINAYTPHRVEDGQERRIYLTLTWPRDKDSPEIQLSYDEPGYYESDLWRMLGGSDIAGGLAANTLEKVLNQQMSGMTIYIDRQATGGTTGGNPEQALMVGVGKYLWEDLYLTYRQGLSITADQAVEVEYRLRNMIYIRSSVVRYSNPRYVRSILRNTDEYNLDVKFRWEY